QTSTITGYIYKVPSPAQPPGFHPFPYPYQPSLPSVHCHSSSQPYIQPFRHISHYSCNIDHFTFQPVQYVPDNIPQWRASIRTTRRTRGGYRSSLYLYKVRYYSTV
ncbi:unnamed protein product, partial [Tuber aestivum]